MIKWLPGKAGWQPKKIGDPGKTDDLQEILAPACKVSNLTHSTHKRAPTIATKLNNEQYPQSLPKGGEDERLKKTDLMVTATTRTQTTRRLTQTTLTGHVLKVKCHCGKICKNARGLKIHQSRTTCGKGEKQASLRVKEGLKDLTAVGEARSGKLTSPTEAVEGFL